MDIWLFTKRSFTVSYKQTILGPAWLFLNPIITSFIYAFVFNGIAGIGTDGVPQILFYLSGTAIWTYFSTCLTKNAIIQVYYNELSFQLDCSNAVHNGGTVTISAIQLAAHMGYRNIYLLGVDHNFDNVIDENGNTVINKDVKNYFCDNYDNDLQDYVVHNLGRTTKGYYALQEFCSKHGVNIYNATRTTKLEAFPKISFEEAVENITNNSR